MSGRRFLEDYEPGTAARSQAVEVTAEEIRAFAGRFDPLAVHLEAAAAQRAGFSNIIASGAHIVALRTRLLHSLGDRPRILAALGWDEVRFHRPVHPGDALTLRLEILERRPSRSRPDRGIVRSRIELFNQRGERVFSQLDAVLVAARGPS